MSQELKSIQGTVTEFFRDDKGGVLSFSLKNQAIRAMFFQNCVFINGRRCLTTAKEISVGQIRKFLKVGDQVEFDCVPNQKPNSYNIRWKATNVWKGQRPLASQKLPSFPEPSPPALPTVHPSPPTSTGLIQGLVVFVDGEDGVISIKRPSGNGEELCHFDRKMCNARKNEQVKLVAHTLAKPVPVGKFKCTFSAEKVAKETRSDFDADEVTAGNGSWTHVESKVKPKPTTPVPTVLPLPEDHKSLMIYNQIGTILEDFGWKAVIGFSYNGIAQRALLVSKKHDPPVESLHGYLAQGDLVDFDAHEYYRPDGTDAVTWFVSRAKRVPDSPSSPSREERPQQLVKSLVGVSATVLIVDDVNSSGILELLAASTRGNKVYFEAKDVLVDKRPVSLDIPLSAQVSLGDVVKINARPACESDPLDFPWVAEKVLRETRYFSAAVSSVPLTHEVNNNKPGSPLGYARIAEDLKDLEEELDWGDDFDKVEGTNGELRQSDLLEPTPVATPPMSMPAMDSARGFEMPPHNVGAAVPPPQTTTPITGGLQALMHAQTIQNQLILCLLESCSLEMNMHVQAAQNKLILTLLDACNMDTIHANVPILKQWMDLNPTLSSIVREILVKRASAVPSNPYRDRGLGSEPGIAGGVLNATTNSYNTYPTTSVDSTSTSGAHFVNSVGSSNSSSPANRFGSFSPFEPARPGASASPIGTGAAAAKPIGVSLPGPQLIADLQTVSGDVVIVRIIDETKGIAKFCDGGPYHGEEVEFTKQVCKFLGKPLSFTPHLSSVARPEGLGSCRAIRSDNLKGVPWLAEELNIK